MTIKFVCNCGKRLRARDEMAMRRVVCPGCGELCGVPSLHPTFRGATAGPLTPAERLRTRRCVLPGDNVLSDSQTGAGVELFIDLPQTDVDPDLGKGADKLAQVLLDNLPHNVVPPTGNGRRAKGALAWFHVLLFPVRVIFLVVFHGVLLATILVPAGFLARTLLANEAAPLWAQLALGTFLSILPVAVAGYAFSFLDSVLGAPAQRDVRLVLNAPSRDLGPALKSALQWCVCFLAGPIVPIGIGIGFWIYGGVFTVIDWLIVAELVSLAASYWLFALASVHQNDCLRDANPYRVFDLIHRLGYRAAVIGLFASALALTHGFAGLVTLAALQQNAGGGWLSLAGWCISGMFWATLLFRLLGVWCKRKPAAV